MGGGGGMRASQSSVGLCVRVCVWLGGSQQHSDCVLCNSGSDSGDDTTCLCVCAPVRVCLFVCASVCVCAHVCVKGG